MGALVTLAFWCGCSSPPEEGKTLIPAERSTVLLMDPELARQIQIEGQSLERSGSGDLVARTELVNLTESPLTVSVRSLFKDMEGMTRETSDWTNLDLPPQEITVYREFTRSGDLARFLVQIRRVAP